MRLILIRDGRLRDGEWVGKDVQWKWTGRERERVVQKEASRDFLVCLRPKLPYRIAIANTMKGISANCHERMDDGNIHVWYMHFSSFSTILILVQHFNGR